jgi:hypothetical protein
LVNYGANPSPFAAIQAAVRNAYAVAPVATNAKILTSSGSPTAGIITTVAYVDDGAGTVKIGYAAAGDTDFDLALTISDLNPTIASGFTGVPIAGTDYVTGDFDHDGSTTISDINLMIAQGFTGTPIVYLAAENPSSGDGVPDLLVWPNGDAVLDTDGLSLSAFQVQSKGLNGAWTAAGDGDGYLNSGRTAIGAFFFNNSSISEYAGSLGSLPAGDHSIPGLINLAALTADGKVLNQALLDNDVKFVYNGAPIGGVHLVPDPGTLALLGMGIVGLVLRRRRRA